MVKGNIIEYCRLIHEAGEYILLITTLLMVSFSLLCPPRIQEAIIFSIQPITQIQWRITYIYSQMLFIYSSLVYTCKLSKVIDMQLIFFFELITVHKYFERSRKFIRRCYSFIRLWFIHVSLVKSLICNSYFSSNWLHKYIEGSRKFIRRCYLFICLWFSLYM